MKLRHERGSLADKNKALKLLIVFSIIVLIILSAIICVAFGKETYSKKFFSGSNSKANVSKNTTTYVWIFDDAEKYGGTKKITGLLDLDSEIKYNDGTYGYKIINWEDVAAKLDIPKREHYKFEGYYRDDGEKVYDEEGYKLAMGGSRWNPTVEANRWQHSDDKLSSSWETQQHLTAKWVQTSTVTKTLDKKGGDGGADKLTQTKDGSIQADGKKITNHVDVPTKDKHTFLGYYNGDDKQRIDKDGNALFKTLGDDGTWHAKWKQKANTTLTVKLNKQNGTGGASEFTQVADSQGKTTLKIDGANVTGKISVPSSISKKYAFSGYNTKKDASGTVKVDAKGNVKFETLSSDGTWYAMWALTSPINVTLDKRGGIGGISKITKITSGEYWQTDGSGTMLGQSLKDKTIDVPTKSGYTFLGYYTEENAKGSQRTDENGKILVDGNINEIADDETWYAAYEDTTTPTPDPSTEEYEVNLYDSDKATVLSTLKLKDGYFYQDGNKIEKNGKFNLPTKDGYKFVSYRSYGGGNQWILSDGTFGSEEQYNAVYNCIKNDYGTCSVYMYAEWTENQKTIYTVTFDANGGTGAPASMNKKEGEATNITSATPTQEGYAFTGWNTTKDGTGTTYQPGESYTKDEEVTLYAQWRRYVHTVKFDANGGTLTDEQATKTYGMEFNLSAYKPTRNGYTFLGWNTAQDGSGTTYTDQYNYDQDGGTVTLYAQWIQYNVNIIELDKQQGTGGTDALYDKGDEKSWYLDKECKLSIEENGSIDKPKREGYWFNGYYTEQNGNGDQIFDHNGNKTSKFIHVNCKIYAYWTAYKFTLDADGGEVSQTEITSTDGGVLPSATKEGLIFVGWARYSGEVSIKANTPYALKDLEDLNPLRGRNYTTNSCIQRKCKS